MIWDGGPQNRVIIYLVQLSVLYISTYYKVYILSLAYQMSFDHIYIPDGLARDAREKRAIYIERNVEIMQEFSVAHPDVKCRINRIFNSSFPDSVLYNLSSDSVKHIVSSWSVSVKQMWGLPHQAHRYLVRELGGQHAEEILILRCVTKNK